MVSPGPVVQAGTPITVVAQVQGRGTTVTGIQVVLNEAPDAGTEGAWRLASVKAELADVKQLEGTITTEGLTAGTHRVGVNLLTADGAIAAYWYELPADWIEVTA